MQRLSPIILGHAQKILEQASNAYCLPASELSKLEVSTDLRGRAAGKVEFKLSARRNIEKIRMRFNLEAANFSLEHMLEDVIPHEIAHLVVYLQNGTKTSRPHCNRWRQVCIALGGSGDVTHKLPLANARQQRRWLYQDTLGGEHSLSTVRHNRLQKGARYLLRVNGAEIAADGFVGEATACRDK